jgi:predicted ATP-dependent protease
MIDVDEPAWPALAGRVEHMPINGALSTNHTLVRPGALHAAHGGFLIVEARRLLSHSGAWMGLKRALRQQLIRTEAPTPEPGVANAVTLEPAPMPLDVNVVLIGTHSEYRTLTTNDPDFALLFGVAAEFEDDMPWTDENVGLLARRLADLGRRDGVCSLRPAALAVLSEHAGRMAGDQTRLSLAIEPLRRIHREANFLASAEGEECVGSTHVVRAIDGQQRREGGAAERNRRGYLNGSVRVRTDGGSVGEVNALAVLSTGRMRFGMASRISARAWPGRGAVINIEGESGLSGSFHDKGIMVLTGLLGGRYAQNVPLCVTATLVFEQSYTPVDGDSASMAETIAVLSSLSGVPVLQGRAITGSVDQNGGAQAIGGVNDKVEGFYDLCNARTLTGQQGVVIPRANVSDLMLRQDIVDAIRTGQFHVWSMDTVDDAFEVLTGIPAGEQCDDGTFTPGSPNATVQQRLATFADTMRQYAGS